MSLRCNWIASFRRRLAIETYTDERHGSEPESFASWDRMCREETDR